MTLRFIDLITSESQPAASPSIVSSGSNDSAESKLEMQVRYRLFYPFTSAEEAYFVLYINRQNTLFDVGRSVFDVERSLISFSI